MANYKHERIAKQGVAVWNDWRKHNSEKTPEDKTPDLNGIDLSGEDWSGANFERTDFVGANLEDINLEGAILTGALDSSGVQIGRSYLNGANLKNANLNRADLRRAIFVGADLTGATLVGANLSESDLTNATFIGSNLTGANLWEIQTVDWIIKGVICEYCYFDRKEKNRTPKDRKFEQGEFEKIYSSYPTFEYFFEKGMHPLAPWLADQIAQGIKEELGADIEIESFTALGAKPSIKLRVKNKGQLATAQGKFDPRMDFLLEQVNKMQITLSKKNQNIINNHGEINMVDTKNVFNIGNAIQSQFGPNSTMNISGPTQYNNTPSLEEIQQALNTIQEKKPENDFTQEVKVAVTGELKKYLLGEVKELSASAAKWVGTLLTGAALGL